jgi:RHH-type proline utilization regulon transcriptional repressor/proline dehydrogenase/delta 1-pyrroline-5-carboxylate dehydrogenase
MVSKRFDNELNIETPGENEIFAFDESTTQVMSKSVIGDEVSDGYFSKRLKQNIPIRSQLRTLITEHYRDTETTCVSRLLPQANFPAIQADAIQTLAKQLATALRQKQSEAGRGGLLQALIQTFSLSSQEGIALMCLAEALLRIPDRATRDSLIRDKIAPGQWREYLGKSHSIFINAAAWGLLITGKLISTHNETNLSAILTRLLAKGGEPLIRKAVDVTMRMMGEQFVMGETIEQALSRARAREEKGFTYSYDMLGEAAQTAEDAERYFQSYEQAIHAIGQKTAGTGIYVAAGISIKLSALHLRYSHTQRQRVMQELYPRVKSLAMLACQYKIGLNLDAEEADRLDLSLDILEKLCFETELHAWQGIGFVVQAYQKRAPYVIDFIIDLARRCQHRVMVRLVKGAYWDSEIKRAQVEGLEDYPVYTRKVHTDICYLVCAKKMLAVADIIYPQFATHNAHTVAAIATIAQHSQHHGLAHQYEFQCLHGMGEMLYDAVQQQLGRACRIYAPVGSHQTLLPYLVRRLLENGANTSFVNQIADNAIAIDNLIADPYAIVKKMGPQPSPHPKIPLPRDLYRIDNQLSRINSFGIDLSDEQQLRALTTALDQKNKAHRLAVPIVDEAHNTSVSDKVKPILNPADHRDIVGHVQDATPLDIDKAIQSAKLGVQQWSNKAPVDRAAILENAAALLEVQRAIFIALAVREAGKSIVNAIGEVREAIDFLRYYAWQLRTEKFLQDGTLPLGPIVCISPWNFPLAIFIGQISAALAAGNSVLAKPAEQTPLIAAQAIHLLHRAGVPRCALQMLPGAGERVGQALVQSNEIAGVMFTGSTTVARVIQQQLAGRLNQYGQPLTLIAETGGLNAMIVDSSALPEQVVRDVLQSAFDSAGQRCSALRILCLQEEIADAIVAMLKGAMQELTIGDPAYLATDIGPVIDAEAYTHIRAYIQKMRDNNCPVYQANRQIAAQHATFIPPTLIEIATVDALQEEVFGPVLHIVRYQRTQLDTLIHAINALGYGLTMGVHTRIDETVKRICAKAQIGNLYVNRNMIGAVVGVQPFGGQGLSGTGPKAGGAFLLRRLLAQESRLEVEQNSELASLPTSLLSAEILDQQITSNMHSLCTWLHNHQYTALADIGHLWLHHIARPGRKWFLPGPTGEENSYSLLPRGAVLCFADTQTNLLLHTLACLNSSNRALWLANPANRSLYTELPDEIKKNVQIVAFEENDLFNNELTHCPDVVLFSGALEKFHLLSQHSSNWPGALKQIIILQIDSIQGNNGLLGSKQQQLTNQSWSALSTKLMHEQVLSINTAAAGGNASLMVVG